MTDLLERVMVAMTELDECEVAVRDYLVAWPSRWDDLRRRYVSLDPAHEEARTAAWSVLHARRERVIDALKMLAREARCRSREEAPSAPLA